MAPLYKKGLSITDICNQTGLKRNSVWKTLKSTQRDLRSQSSVPFTQWKKGRGKTKAKPPYGFCYFQGQVVQDPKEYPTLLLIKNLWKRESSISSIVRHLNGKCIPSRTGKAWSYNVIKSIIKRTEEGQLDHLSDESLELRGIKPNSKGELK